jgi:ABC-type transport system substrate-binding protein
MLLFAMLRMSPKRCRHTESGGGRDSAYSRAAIFAVAIVCAVACAACAKPEPLAGPDFLHVDIATSPTSLDPRFASDAISSRLDELIYDSMVRVDGSGIYVNDLAESVQRPSPTALIFHLRHGVRFSDGRELTAHDVKYTYDSVLDLASLSLKRASLSEMASMRVLDNYTLAMTTRRPFASALEMATFGIVPYGSPSPGRGILTAAPGTGPFRLDHFVRDEIVVLARNSYRPAPKGSAHGIVFKIVPDATVRALEMTEGICDFAENDAVQLELIPYLAAQPSLRVVKSPGTTYQYLIFNFRDPRLRDVRVRRAISYAIDREQIVNTVLRGVARPATGMLAPENWAYEGSVTRYPYDPATARRLLEDAGYTPGGRRLTFVYNTTPEGRNRGEALQAMLKKVGITLDIHTNEWGTFYSDLSNGNFDLASSQWVGINDPHQYYMIFDSKMTPARGGSNRGGYSNQQMDRLLEAGDTALDPGARRRIYSDVQKLAAEDLPYLSLWWVDNLAVLNRRVSGFQPYPNGSLVSFSTVTLTPPAIR